jgi:hypothetical protein
VIEHTGCGVNRKRKRSDNPHVEVSKMGMAIALVLLALLLGGVGLAVEALRWVLIIALVLFVLSAISGFRGRAAGPP